MEKTIVNLASGTGRGPEPERLSPLAAVWRGIEALIGRVKALEAKRPREIVKARISDGGSLVLSYSDGTEADAGRVVGAGGEMPVDMRAAVDRLLARVDALEAAAARPRKKKTIVTKKNDDGSIAEFVQEEVPD